MATRANDKTYRVYRPTDALRKQITAKREQANVNTQAIIEAAITEELPTLVQTLKGLGLGFAAKDRRPARWPMTDSMLGALKVASKQTGIPATRLLYASLTTLCGHKNGRGRKGGAK